MSTALPELSQPLLDALRECPELLALRTELQRFNIFRVLGAENNELRHSNMLAWLLDPAESHELGDRFLQSWLASVAIGQPDWDTTRVRVLREWNHIDILVKLRDRAGARYAVVIENKVDSTQGENQLARYRELIGRLVPDSQHLLVFLTRRPEEPADDGWAPSNYAQVADVLSALVDDPAVSISPGPRLLITHYTQLIRSQFMEDGDLVKLARKIYDEHQRALDFIFEHREDRLELLSRELQERMVSVERRACSKQFVRFLPHAWRENERNNAGTAWGATNSAFVLCELALTTQVPTLKIVEGNLPEPLRSRFFEALQANASLVEGGRPKKPAQWMTIFSRQLTAVDPGDTIEEQAGKIWSACERTLAGSDFAKALEIYTPLLAELPEAP